MIAQTSFIYLLLKILIPAVSSMSQQKYSFKTETNVNTSLNYLWLIRNLKFSSRLECLAQCSLLDDCFSVLYDLNSSSTNNCALYSRIFLSFEFVSLKNTNLYFKECNFFLFSLL